MNGKKDIQKSVRMTQQVYDFIEKTTGDGFNQKFENLVLSFMTSESEHEKKIKFLEKQYNDLFSSVKDLTKIERDLTRIQQYIILAKGVIKEAPVVGQLKI